MILPRSNHALDTNPPQGEIHLSTHGSDWLYAVTAVFIITFLVFFFFSSIYSRASRAFYHYVFTIVLLVGSITYFAQGSDLGSLAIVEADHNKGETRQVFWPKYVFWVVAFPAVILVLSHLRAELWWSAVYQIALAWTWIITYLVGSFTQSNYKWGFFAFGTFAALTLIGNLHHVRNDSLGREHHILTFWISILWIMYPIAWGLSDGGNRIGVTGGFVFFGILDILLFCVTALFFMFRRPGSGAGAAEKTGAVV